WLWARDRHEHLELQLLFALARRQHPPAAPEERVRSDVQLGLEPEPVQQPDGAVAPLLAPRADDVRLSDAHDLPLMKHLQAGGVTGGLVTEHIGAAGVDRDAPAWQPPAGGHDRIGGV